MVKRFVILIIVMLMAFGAAAEGKLSKGDVVKKQSQGTTNSLGVNTEYSKKVTNKATYGTSRYGSYSTGTTGRSGGVGTSEGGGALVSSKTSGVETKSEKTDNSLGVSGDMEGGRREKRAKKVTITTSEMTLTDKTWKTEYKTNRLLSREIGSLETFTTNDYDGDSGFTPFSVEDFNDATPKDYAGPVGDAILPMMLLLGFVVAYKGYKKD